MRKRIILLLASVFMIEANNFAQRVTQQIPDKLIVLTFDDATASHYSVVAPLLIEYDFGATFFVCEFPPNFRDSSKYMNWRQIKELDKMGFEIANHTHDHPLLNKLNRKQICEQINYIEEKFDSLHISRTYSFAYPAYGVNDTVLSILGEKGYRLARIGGDRVYNPAKDNPLLIPSWCMTEKSKLQIMDALKEAKGGNIVVFTIHGVPDLEHPWVNTAEDSFKQLLKYLAENHFTVISLGELQKYIELSQ